MAYLTHKEILLANPFNGAPHRMVVYHNPDWWNQIVNPNLGTPIRLKFDENIRNNMPDNIHNGKGIYMFFLEPNHPFPNDILMRHILYVGRVQEKTSNFNFFKRFYYYVSAIGNRTVARNIMRLTNLWPDHTYVYYFDLSNKTDIEIVNIEKNIFNKIVPPLNEELHGEARLTRQFY